MLFAKLPPIFVYAIPALMPHANESSLLRYDSYSRHSPLPLFDIFSDRRRGYSLYFVSFRARLTARDDLIRLMAFDGFIDSLPSYRSSHFVCRF